MITINLEPNQLVKGDNRVSIVVRNNSESECRGLTIRLRPGRNLFVDSEPLLTFSPIRPGQTLKETVDLSAMKVGSAKLILRCSWAQHNQRHHEDMSFNLKVVAEKAPSPSTSPGSKPAPPDKGLIATGLVQMHLSGDEFPLTVEKQKLLSDIIASLCRVPPRQVQISRMESEGRWISLEIPQRCTDRLINARKQELLPLLAKFDIQNINLLSVRLPHTGLEHFKPEYKSLVRLLYLGLKEVLIERELGGGFGGAMVLLVQPIGQNGRRIARQIIKIGTGAELRRERQNSADYVEKDLSLVAPRLIEYVEWQGLAGISYVFVNDSILGQTRSLEEYFQDKRVSAAHIIQTLDGLLDQALGQIWYGQATSYSCHFSSEYGRHLVEHLRLKLRPASTDGIWPVAEAPGLTESYGRLTGEEIVSSHRRISAGTLVQVERLIITKIKPGELKLQHPSDPGIVVKVEGSSDSNTFQRFSLDDRVIIRGEVVYNRHNRLEQIVGAIFVDYPEVKIDVKQEELNLSPNTGRYPNPLQSYPAILNLVLNGRKSMVHGDLHLRNVLVDQDRRGWLIDFARVTERHNLYDLIKLETFIRQMILSREEYGFSFAAYLQFEEALVTSALGTSATPPDDPDLQKAFQVIQSLRKIAAHYMDYPADFRGEYFPALFLYNLAVLKYHHNHGDKAARLAFATAAVLGRALTQDEPDARPVPEYEAEPTAPLTKQTEVKKQPIITQTESPLSPDDAEFLQKQLAQHKQNLRLLRQQESIYGAGEAPLHLLNQIDAEKRKITEIQRQLETDRGKPTTTVETDSGQSSPESSRPTRTIFRVQLLQHGPEYLAVRGLDVPGGGQPKSEVPLPCALSELKAVLKALDLGEIVKERFKPEYLAALENLGLSSGDRLRTDFYQLTGQKLFGTLISGDILTEFRIAERATEPIACQLCFDPEDVILAQFPWELIHDERMFLVPRSRGVELTRYITFSTPPTPLQTRLPLRVLFINPRPGGTEKLPDMYEREALRGVLEPLRNQGKLTWHELDPPTWADLEDCLNSQTFDIIHFDGHGSFARICPHCGAAHYPSTVTCEDCQEDMADAMPKGYLDFENEEHQLDRVGVAELNVVLADSRTRLMVLTACGSGVVQGTSVFNGVAPGLIQAGVPAVVAMQGSPQVGVTLKFIKRFYQGIAEGQCIPEAVNRGRRAIFRDKPIAWFMPVVYLRSADQTYGQLFEI